MQKVKWKKCFREGLISCQLNQILFIQVLNKWVMNNHDKECQGSGVNKV